MRNPPGSPSAKSNRPSRTAIIGAIEVKTRRLFRQRAVSLLEFYPSEETRKVLLEALRDEYGPVRKEAVKALKRYMADNDVKTSLLQALEDSSVVVRKTAIRVLQSEGFAREALLKRQKVEKDMNARLLLQQMTAQ